MSVLEVRPVFSIREIRSVRGFPACFRVILAISSLSVGCDDDQVTAGPRACLLTSDCESNERCVDRICVRDEVINLSCSTDAECSSGSYCDAQERLCYPVECLDSNDCALYETCDRGRCLVDVEADQDRDGVPDGVDNCESDLNPDQADRDGDSIGDLCDPDVDGDEIANVDDNCVYVPNMDQLDSDGDGAGDACQGDIDGDLWRDPVDNCREVYNRLQEDLDQDGIGDLCDPDIDGDNVNNTDDNCPLHANPNQEDQDEDGVGDLCSAENLWRCGECGILDVIDGQVQCVEQRCAPNGVAIEQCVSDSSGRGVWVLKESCIVERFGVVELNTCYPQPEPTCVLLSYCGDYVVDEGEECDDGNLADGDGCSRICTSESDTDGDGVPDNQDKCLGDDATGDSDQDEVCDELDLCPGTDDAERAIRYRDQDGDGATVASEGPVCADDPEFTLTDPGAGATDIDDTDPSPQIVSLTLITSEGELTSGEFFELELLYDQPVIVRGGPQSFGISLTVNTTLGPLNTHAPFSSHDDRALRFTHQILGSYQELNGVELNGRIDRRFESVTIRSASPLNTEASYESPLLAGRLNITTPPQGVLDGPQLDFMLSPSSYYAYITDDGYLYHFMLTGIVAYDLNRADPMSLDGSRVGGRAIVNGREVAQVTQAVQRGDFLITLADNDADVPLQEIKIYDISDRAAPMLLHTLKPESDSRFVGDFKKLSVVDDSLVITTSESIYVYDALDLTTLTLTASYEALKDSFPDLTDICFDPERQTALIALGFQGYQVLDLSDYPVSTPTLLSDETYTGRCLYDGRELFMFDELNARIMRYTASSPVESMLDTLQEDDPLFYLYTGLIRGTPSVNHQCLSLPMFLGESVVFDLDDPAQKRYLISGENEVSDHHAAYYNDHFYVTNEAAGLNIYRFTPDNVNRALSLLTEPQRDVRGELRLVHNGLAYIQSFQEDALFHIIDVSDPRSPRHIRTLGLAWIAGQPDRISIKGRYLVKWNPESLITIYDLDSIDPNTFTPSRSVTYESPVFAVITDVVLDKTRDYLYYSTGSGGIITLDVGDITAINEVNSINVETRIDALFNTEDVLYYISGRNRVRSIDIVDITTQDARPELMNRALQGLSIGKIWRGYHSAFLELLEEGNPPTARLSNDSITIESFSFSSILGSDRHTRHGLFHTIVYDDPYDAKLVWRGPCPEPDTSRECTRIYQDLWGEIGGSYAVQLSGDYLYVLTPEAGLSVYATTSDRYLVQDLPENIARNELR